MRIGLVGLGFIGKAHFAAYLNIPKAQVAAVCIRDKQKSLRAIEQMSISARPDIYTNYDELLMDDSIDVIDLCVPTFLHEEYIVKAARAGKHIICEKPLTLTKESADRILEIVEKEKVKLFVGHILRFWPEYSLLKDYKEKGLLENVEIIHAKRLGQVPFWSRWFQLPEKSGGALYDLHMHEIDYIHYLLGDVKSVYAVGSQNKYGAWNHVMTTLTFTNGAKAFMEASHKMPETFPFTMSLRLQAKGETIDFYSASGKNIEDTEGGDRRFLRYSADKVELLTVDSRDPFEIELQYFLDCIRKGQENEIVPLEDVLYTIRLMEAIECSLVGGRKITL